MLMDIARATPDIALEPGHSGYFSAPQAILDPTLFEGDHLIPLIRMTLLDTLGGFWHERYNRWEHWATVWLAGSGISYQWAGDRADSDMGVGDLDVLIGVNSLAFKASNPYFAAWGEIDIDNMLTDELRQGLWPRTANANLNGKNFEITWFVNQRAEDIRTIHPYAAYNVSTDEWTSRPPELPADPMALYSAAWYAAARHDTAAAEALVDKFNLIKKGADRLGGSFLPGVIAQARSLFSDIHTGRRDAFGPSGLGYGDWANFRWQSAKQSGAIGALKKIVEVGDIDQQREDLRLYGGPVASSDEALRAALAAVSRR
jgi:hypothetical protein